MAATEEEEDELLQPLLRLRRRLDGLQEEPHLGREAAAPGPGGPDARAKKPPGGGPRLNAHSAFWIAAAAAVTYHVQFFRAVQAAWLAGDGWLRLGAALLAVSLAVAFFCIVYLEWYRGVEDYDAAYPALIPVTTAAFLAAALCFNVALWPAWALWTPAVLFTQFMGVVMLVALLG